jgi:hypothetical protein
MRSLLLPGSDKTSGLPVIPTSPPLVRVTIASLEERNVLLQNGLDFYGATFFPTEAATSTPVLRTSGRKSILGNRYSRPTTIRKYLTIVEPEVSSLSQKLDPSPYIGSHNVPILEQSPSCYLSTYSYFQACNKLLVVNLSSINVHFALTTFLQGV